MPQKVVTIKFQVPFHLFTEKQTVSKFSRLNHLLLAWDSAFGPGLLGMVCLCSMRHCLELPSILKFGWGSYIEESLSSLSFSSLVRMIPAWYLASKSEQSNRLSLNIQVLINPLLTSHLLKLYWSKQVTRPTPEGKGLHKSRWHGKLGS